ncbi:hypothetical protein PRK78_006587 [Emydomyces testavorans]|uniref:SRP9 domain-containing protein n=1 Tax=Emydomyces testavorans TaxID=2070801 RepID=A0AAF0DMD8_9EURO|nr:hypothetical protein PRK78_006587 [Emydomyces testavorans]
MPYLTTSQDFLKQSSLLLEAYPHTVRSDPLPSLKITTNLPLQTRITTKYSYPKPTRKPESPTNTKDATTTTTTTTSTPTQPAPATLTFKTYNPHSGICLKYRTTKAAEVSRLIAGLGRLASGAPIADATTSAAPTQTQQTTHAVTSVSAGDVEMLDSSAVTGAGAGAGSGSDPQATTGKGNGGGGGKRKKGGKGRR